MKHLLLGAVVAVLLGFCMGYSSPTDNAEWRNNTYYLIFDNQAEYSVLTPEEMIGRKEPVIATAIVNTSLDAYGWDYVMFTGNAQTLKSPGAQRGFGYYDVGYLEGYTTAERLWQVFEPTGAFIKDMTVADNTWVDAHIEYMFGEASAAVKRQSKGTANETDVYWLKVHDLLQQIQGIADGVTAKSGKNMTFRNLFLLNFNDEIGDVQLAVDPLEERNPELNRRQHCSALVKNVGDEIFFSHVTWGHYRTMVRQFKTYEMETTVSMSSVAGTIMSGDDWYMLYPSKMAVQETTNEFASNEIGAALAKKYVVPKTISEFIRVMVANYIATDVTSWKDAFVFKNSGTYNNQYMVLDTTKFAKGQAVPDEGLLYVVEQMPGAYKGGDMSATLKNKGYWASYNLPHFKEIYDRCGFLAAEKKYGPYYSYTNYSRAEIFRRNESMVTDLETMELMMRYNDFKVDPLSKIPNCARCNPTYSPWLVIASRGDLVEKSWVLPEGPYGGSFEQAPFGAIDAKITSTEMIKTMTGRVISGPTAVQQKPFRWSTSPFPQDIPPGSPDLFDFDWVTFNYPGSLNNAPAAAPEKKKDTGMIVAIVIGVLAVVTAIAVVSNMRRTKRRQSGDEYQPIA